MSKAKEVVVSNGYAKMELELSEEMDSLEGLRIFEGQLDIAHQDRIEVRTRMAYHIYMILNHELWRHVRDDDGNQVFNTQEEYLTENEARWQMGVSTARALYATVRMAGKLGYDSAAAIVDQGGIHLFDQVRQRVKIDRKTGEITALKAGEPPKGITPTEWALDTIKEVSSAHGEEGLLRPKDVIRKLDEKLVVGKPLVEFIRDPMKPLGDLGWSFSQSDVEENGHLLSGIVKIEFLVNGSNEPVPHAVKQRFYELLKVL
jgi:hypothetical protein